MRRANVNRFTAIAAVTKWWWHRKSFDGAVYVAFAHRHGVHSDFACRSDTPARLRSGSGLAGSGRVGCRRGTIRRSTAHSETSGSFSLGRRSYDYLDEAACDAAGNRPRLRTDSRVRL